MNPVSQPFRRCDGITRRDVLQIGRAAFLGLSLADLVALRRLAAQKPPAAGSRARARSCIVVWLDGGPSHLETWDLKPDAPAEVRGPFAPIATSVPGMQICEWMPNTARIMQHLAIIRSMTSPLGEHNFGTHYLMTGHKPSPVLEYASYGAVVAMQRGAVGGLPPHVAIPDFRVGGGKLTGNGFLPVAVQPFAVGGDPGRPDFHVRDLAVFAGGSLERIERRRSFVTALDRFSRLLDNSGQTPVDDATQQAYQMITSTEAQAAFDLAQEPAAVRERYGRRTLGQCCLLARRLVERGVAFVTVNHRGWDTHTDLVTRLRDGYTGALQKVGLIPSLDQALAALIKDLHERGMLNETLVLVMGEFGRTPKVNAAGGRDHWPRVFSLLLAGGGVHGGQVIGSSDSVGESPREHPVTPEDLACTLYTLLGIDPAQRLMTADGRPVRVVDESGRLLSQLLG